jgi:hypothetical protein
MPISMPIYITTQKQDLEISLVICSSAYMIYYHSAFTQNRYNKDAGARIRVK